MITPKPCRSCKAPILLVRKAENSKAWMPVAAEPVEPSRVYDASSIRILRGDVYAYTLEHMREVLRERLAFDTEGAIEAEDYPWHPVHRCESGRD